MSELEDRLQKASAAVRRAAEHAVPEPMTKKATSMWKKPALAFSGALVGVALVVGVAALLRPDPAGQVTATTVTAPTDTTARPSDSTTTTAADTTTTLATVAGPGCPPPDLEQPAQQDGLPEPVATMRALIIGSAMACDVARLEELGGADLVTSFGGGGPERFAEAVEAGEPLLETLVKVLSAPYAHITYGDGSEDYVWPSAFAYDTWDEIPAADLEALLAIYTPDELDELEAFGSYAGWRAGITPDGDWRFFVAGD